MKHSFISRLLLTTLIIAAVLAFFLRGRFGVEPPVPVNIANLDPDVAALIQASVDAVRRDRRDIEKRTVLGKVYEANDLHDLASQTYRQVLDQDGSLSEVWFRLAICLEREGDLEQAIAAMDRSIELKPDFAASHWRRSMWLLDTGAVDEAATAADQATRLDKLDDSGWFAQANVHLARRENQPAIDVINSHNLTSTANGRFANFLIGRAYQQMGQLERSIPYLQEDEFRPVWRDNWSRELYKYQTGIARMRSTASILVKQAKSKEAITLLRQIVRRKPDDTRSLNMLGVCLLQTQEYEKAFSTFGKSLRVAPEDHSTNLNYAVALLAGKQSGLSADLQEALQHVETAIRVRPKSAKAHEARGQILMRLDQVEEAIAAFEQAYELDSRTPARAIAAANAEIKQGRYEAATNRLNALVESAPDYASVYLAIAGLHAKRSEFAEAVAMLEKAQSARVATPREEQVIRLQLNQLRPLIPK